MQHFTLIGNVGRAAEVRQAANGQAIGFSVACNETYKDKQGQKQEKTTWYEVTLWKKLGESTRLADFLKPGQTVAITGRPYADAYLKDGAAVAKQCVRVERLELVGSVKGQSDTAAGESTPAVHTATDDDNDLPF